MTSTLRLFLPGITLGGSASSCSRHYLHRIYSSIPAGRDWRSAGHPPPRSILDDAEPVDLSEDNSVVDGARPNTPPLHRRTPPAHPTPHEHASHREFIKKTFPEGWAPPRKLSREAMDGLRQLHHFDREMFTTPVLAEKFRISPEAVRRILKSKWEPTREQKARYAEKERQRRGAFIKMSRIEERIRALEIERERRKDEGNGEFGGGETNHRAHGRVRGINAKDKLTFQ